MVEILIGMIASGKSTYCRKRAEEGALIVNDDSIVTAIHGGNYKLYNHDLKLVYEAVGQAIINYGTVCNNKDIVIDRTNLKKSTRARYIMYADVLKTPVIAVTFPIETPEIHAKRRTDSDARGYDFDYWLKVAKAHLESYEEPSIDEGFAELRHIDDLRKEP
jgi:predicted kinase